MNTEEKKINLWTILLIGNYCKAFQCCCQFHLSFLHKKYMHRSFLIQCPCLLQSRAQCSGEWSHGDNNSLQFYCLTAFFLFLSFWVFVGHNWEPPWSWIRAGVQKDVADVSSALRSDYGKLCMAFMLLWSFYYYWDFCCLEYFLEHFYCLHFLTEWCIKEHNFCFFLLSAMAGIKKYVCWVLLSSL